MASALFSAHMVQHLLLMLVAAPLFAMSRLSIAFIWGLPPEWRRGVGRWWKRLAFWSRGTWMASQPAIAWLLYGTAIWLWHLPYLYQAALNSPLVHDLEHVTFFGSAFLFWWVLGRLHQQRGSGSGAAVICLFTTALHGGALGALITFSSVPWYPIYEQYTAAWGLTPLEDQQLAGAIMWVPMGIVYVIAASLFLLTWLQRMENGEWRMENGA
jgi:putative membrane protein